MTEQPRRPHGYTIFCDDIRHEIGGQKSYIGVYGHILAVHEIPVAIPKLGAAVTILIGRYNVPDKINLQVYLPGDVDGQPSFGGEMPTKEVRELPTDVVRDHQGDRMVAARVDLIMSPLVITTTGNLRILAVIGDETINLGRLPIIHRPIGDKPEEISQIFE